MQRRLLPHTQVCYRWLVQSERTWGLVDSEQRELYFEKGEKNQTLLVAIHLLGEFYIGQGKLAEAESLCKRALQGMEVALGPKHILTRRPRQPSARLLSHRFWCRRHVLYRPSLSVRRQCSILPVKHAGRSVGFAWGCGNGVCCV
jgi:hypothetical protein